jgi:hypothetical protein
MFPDFTDDSGAGDLQTPGNGAAAVAMAQPVLDLGAGCKGEVLHGVSLDRGLMFPGHFRKIKRPSPPRGGEDVRTFQ